MAQVEVSVKGALAGGLSGLALDLALTELTGHHIASGLWELLGVAIGLFRLDRRLAEIMQDTVTRAKIREDEDYREVAARIDQLTADLPELRETLRRLVEAGMAAHKA